MHVDEVKGLIEKGFPDAEVFVKGEGDHFEAIVISASFEGESRVRQHQRVYQSLGDLMQAEIHALALFTYTPDQWAANRRVQ